MAPLEKFQPPLEGAESPWFLIVETVTLAPKSSAVVDVVAAAPGEKYNIEPSTFPFPDWRGHRSMLLSPRNHLRNSPAVPMKLFPK